MTLCRMSERWDTRRTPMARLPVEMEDGARGPGMRVSLETGKGREWILPEPPERKPACPRLVQ